MKKTKFVDKWKLPELDLADKLSDSTKSLKVQIVATHSGYLINNRVYPGPRVKASYKTFTSKGNGGSADYDRPVLLHHQSGMGWSEAADPIGRVVGVDFVQLKQGAGFEKDYLQPDMGKGNGSGYVLLDVVISDPDAIQKVLDGRYSTVSIGAMPEDYYCSVCGSSYKTGGCNHMPGETYEVKEDKKKKSKKVTCYLITGNLDYLEVSFVNVPADPKAKVKSVKDAHIQNTQLT